MKQNSNQKFINRLFVVLFFLTAVISNSTAQESFPVSNSELVGTQLPLNASRITDSNVPPEVNKALEKIVAWGGAGLRKGETEVLAWTNTYKKLDAPNLIKQLTANLQTAGWTIEKDSERDGVTVFAMFSESPKKTRRCRLLHIFR